MTIETKHSFNDLVYFMRDNKAAFGNIIGISTRSGEYERGNKMNEGIFYYIKCDGYDQMEMPEKSLYLSREDLIKSI